ncbi:MAG: radical SAM protein [bacterium]|nr:radical SAM protein [bacterium]
MNKESPEYVRISQAAAMVLGFRSGRFYRNATSPCINILLTYDGGCIASCAYCGLSTKRPGGYTEKSFIRVRWDIFPLTDVIESISQNIGDVKRICVSMVTNKNSTDGAVDVIRTIANVVVLPISVLAAPTVLDDEGLRMLRESGADRIGIAVDAATPDLFGEYRGSGVRGPHKWDRYWETLFKAVEVFGRGNVSVHLIVGLGESEEEMVATIQMAYDRGIVTDLFSFFPEADSLLASISQPPMGQYRRIQLARYLINEGLARGDDFTFDDAGRLVDYTVAAATLADVIDSGLPFVTSGCPGEDGDVACNRPYSDSLPGPDIRNFPFTPNEDDIEKIKDKLWS